MSITTTKLDKREVEQAVRGMYEEVADFPDREFHFPTGRKSCLNLGYPAEELDAIPEAAVQSFAGVGYPFLADNIKPGDTIVDVGSGSGVDVADSSFKDRIRGTGTGY